MQWCPLLKLFRNKQKHTVSYLVDLILCGLQRLDDGLQLDLASSQALFQLILLLLQPAQVGLCPAQLFLLTLQVWLLGVDLILEGRDLEAEENEAMWKGSKMNTRHITKGPLFFHNMIDTWLSSLWHHFSCLLIIVGITFAFSRTERQAQIPKLQTLTITLSVKKCQRWIFLPWFQFSTPVLPLFLTIWDSSWHFIRISFSMSSNLCFCWSISSRRSWASCFWASSSCRLAVSLSRSFCISYHVPKLGVHHINKKVAK